MPRVGVSEAVFMGSHGKARPWISGERWMQSFPVGQQGSFEMGAGLHIGVGALCLAVVVGCVYRAERGLIHDVRAFRKKASPKQA